MYFFLIIIITAAAEATFELLFYSGLFMRHGHCDEEHRTCVSLTGWGPHLHLSEAVSPRHVLNVSGH